MSPIENSAPLGRCGKILRVNLSAEEVSIERPSETFYRTYMGGSCFGAYYLLREMGRGADPLGPDNIIVFAASVVTGALLPGFSRSAVISKSPLTDLICDSQAGGSWGPELKFAGFDAVLIKGRAARPVYLWVHDGQAEIRDASQLWGSTTDESLARIRQDLSDSRAEAALIGPAGERLVRFASILSGLRNSFARGGLGAVMGSKNLKAVAVRGHGSIRIAAPDTVEQLRSQFQQSFMENPANRGLHDLGTAAYIEYANSSGQLPTRNFQTAYFENAEAIDSRRLQEAVVATQGCWSCPVACKKLVRLDSPYQVDPEFGGPESETLAAFGSNCGVSDLGAICKANELCAQLGLDSVSTGVAIAFAMECYEQGLLTEGETRGIRLDFGNAEAMVNLVQAIGTRQGLGDLLAEGVMRAAATLGRGATKFAMHTKGRELPMHDPRVKGMLGLSYALSPIGADHIVAEHDHDFDFEAPQIFIDQSAPLGLSERLPMDSLDSRKVRMFCYLQQHLSFMDTLCLCIACFAPVRSYTMQDLVTMIGAITGWETSLWELMKLGERRVNMFRAFNILEGKLGEADWLPDRMFEPIRSGPKSGSRVSEQDFAKALDLYREMMNWDERGIPREAKLIELSLGWLNRHVSGAR